MERSPPKYVLDLKQKVIIQQQNINRLFSICSALYQEIQDLKHHTNFKAPDSLGDVEGQAPLSRNMQANQGNESPNVMNVDKSEQMMGSRGRKMKIINN